MPDETRRVDLSGALTGHWVMVRAEALTFGFLEDMQSPRAGVILDALERVIADSNLPAGHARAGLRSLRGPQMRALIEGVLALPEVPKS